MNTKSDGGLEANAFAVRSMGRGYAVKRSRKAKSCQVWAHWLSARFFFGASDGAVAFSLLGQG
jgi:hypothetical protein